MFKFYTAANLAEAYLIRGLQSAVRIESKIFNENAQGAVGEIPFTQAYPEIWLVDEIDLPHAQEVILKYEGSVGNSHHIACTSCGETNPPTFEVCWNCGHVLQENGG